jgi:hypothetical protein
MCVIAIKWVLDRIPQMEVLVMSCRRHGSKPKIALWMLVAVADVALLVAAGGLVAMLLVAASLLIVVGGFVAGRQLLAQPESSPLTVVPKKGEAVARRRA